MTSEISSLATENYQLRRSSASSNIARPKLIKASTADSQSSSKTRKKNKTKVGIASISHLFIFLFSFLNNRSLSNQSFLLQPIEEKESNRLTVL